MQTKNDRFENFIKKAIKLYNNEYDYSKVDYINAFTKICIICSIHGEFWIRPNNHLSGQGCKLCGINRRTKISTKTIQKFIEDAIKIHGNKYDYSLSIYKNRSTKIKIKCNKCNNIFEKIPYSHLIGQGCHSCSINHHKSVFDYNGNTKICKKCNIEKSLNEFYKGDRSKINPKYVYYRGNCKDCERKQKTEYRKKEINKQRYREYCRKYSKNRRKTDISYKLRNDFSSIVRRALKGNKNRHSLWDKLPYSPSDLKLHLEKQFDENMSWNNHGTYWHIDHIIPQAALEYNSFDHPNFLKCWSLNNLRPLKAEDNIRKSSIINGIRYRNKRKY